MGILYRLDDPGGPVVVVVVVVAVAAAEVILDASHKLDFVDMGFVLEGSSFEPAEQHLGWAQNIVQVHHSMAERSSPAGIEGEGALASAPYTNRRHS